MSSNLNGSELVGPAARELAQAFSRADVPSGILISGEEGAGQNEVAKHLAASFLCLNPTDGEPCSECAACRSYANIRSPDIFIVTPRGKQDLIRLRQINFDEEHQEPHVREFLAFPPLQARNKVVIIERPERLNQESANALLKILEEPPQYGRFILTTGEPSKIAPTIRSRCVFLACDLAPLHADAFVAELAGGAPELAERITTEDNVQFLESLREFAAKLPTLSGHEAIKASEDLLEICSSYKRENAPEEESLRFLRGEAFRYFSNWVAARLRSGDVRYARLLEDCIAAHRAIVGNANAGYAFDAMFSRCLPLR